MVIRRNAFTLIELMTVLAIIALLTGLIIPIAGVLRSRQAKQRSLALVQSVATAIAAYHPKRWDVAVEYPAGIMVRQSYPQLWDMNRPGAGGREVGDGMIDGFPAPATDATHDGPFAGALLASGYRGFANMAAPDLLGGRWLNPQGQPIDAWGTPLRIAFEGANAGATGFRVWSCGPDRMDQQGTGDDIASDGP